VITQATDHPRDLTLRLRDDLVARGRLTSDLAACMAGVDVKIQRRHGRWRTVRTVATNDAGRFSAEIRDRVGRYRALAPATSAGPNDTCLRAKSPVVRHRH